MLHYERQKRKGLIDRGALNKNRIPYEFAKFTPTCHDKKKRIACGMPPTDVHSTKQRRITGTGQA